MPLSSCFVDVLLTGSRRPGFGASARCCNIRNIPRARDSIAARRRPGTDRRARTLRFAIGVRRICCRVPFPCRPY